jgi:CO/xanthine dehydrogenase Mo-binding subunit
MAILGRNPYSSGTYASRSLVMSGGAVSQACKKLIPQILKIGAHLLEADVCLRTFRRRLCQVGKRM